MFQEDLSATSGKNNPLFKLALQPADTVWQEHDGLFEQVTDVARDPRDATNHSMHRVTITIDGAQFFRTEQLVTYSSGSVRQENVYWDTALQIHYWECQTDGKWYFEDPCKDDAITKAGSYKKLLRQLECRQFWWLENDEDVYVNKNLDGSKSYAYKGLNDPAQITVLLEEEAEQELIISEKPVSKWKAVALSAMTLLGNSTGFQSLAKSYVSGPAPNQSELTIVDRHADRLQYLSENSSAAYKESAHTESSYSLWQYPFTSVVEYQSRAIVSALQLFTVMATGVASIIHPRPGREKSMLTFPTLLTLLTGVKSADAYMGVEANKKSFSPEPTGDLGNTETFSHVFAMSTLPDDSLFLTPKAVVDSNPNPALEVPVSKLATVAHNLPVIPSYNMAAASDPTIAILSTAKTPLDIPIYHLPGQSEFQMKLGQNVITRLQEQPAQLSLSKQLPVVSAQSRQASLSDIIKIADDTSKEIERCIREVQEKVILKDEKSAQEKANAVQVLSNLRLVLSRTVESLRKVEKSPNQVAYQEISHQIKILEDALAEVRIYSTVQIQDLPTGIVDVKGSFPASMNFLSTVSSAIADIDSKTLSIISIIMGFLGVLGAGSLAVYMMAKGSNKPSPQQGYQPLRISQRNKKSRIVPYVPSEKKSPEASPASTTGIPARSELYRIAAEAIKARRDKIDTGPKPTADQTNILENLVKAAKCYAVCYEPKSGTIGDDGTCEMTNAHATAAAAVVNIDGNLNVILYHQTSMTKKKLTTIQSAATIEGFCKDILPFIKDIARILSQPKAHVIVLDHPADTGVHAESGIIRYLHYTASTPSDTLASSGFLVGASQEPCPDCAGFLAGLGIPILEVRSKSALLWEDPITGTYYNARLGIELATNPHESTKSESSYVLEFPESYRLKPEVYGQIVPVFETDLDIDRSLEEENFYQPLLFSPRGHMQVLNPKPANLFDATGKDQLPEVHRERLQQ